MRRLFWLAMGVTIGALVVRKASRAVERMTPRGFARSVSGALAELSESIGEFAAEVGVAMREREAELREASGMNGKVGTHREIERR